MIISSLIACLTQSSWCTQAALKTKVTWLSVKERSLIPLPSSNPSILLTRCSFNSLPPEHKVNAVLLLGPSQARKESMSQTTNSSLSPFPFSCPSSSKLIITEAFILQKRHFAVTAVWLVFWAAGLQVISRPSDIHWRTGVPLTLQSL